MSISADRSPRRRPAAIASALRVGFARYRGVRLARQVRLGSGVFLRGPGIAMGDGVEILCGTVIESLGLPSERIELAAGTRVKAHAWLNSYGGSIATGRNVLIGYGCVLLGHGDIRIGDRTMLAPYVTIVASNHAYWLSGSLPERGFTREPITIGADVWLGAHVVVTGGSVIGDDSVVAAGSVVVGTLQAGGLYAGSPARLIRSVREAPSPVPKVERW